MKKLGVILSWVLLVLFCVLLIAVWNALWNAFLDPGVVAAKARVESDMARSGCVSFKIISTEVTPIEQRAIDKADGIKYKQVVVRYAVLGVDDRWVDATATLTLQNDRVVWVWGTTVNSCKKK
jgi:hypothetical protein